MNTISPVTKVEITNKAIVPNDINKDFTNALKKIGQIGALVSFTGIVRNDSNEEITKLVLEHYPGMTEKKLQQLVAEAINKWSLLGIYVFHRFETMYVGDVIVYVVVAAAHRTDAFSACSAIVDRLKSDVPFWKKEVGKFGTRWVTAKETEDKYQGKYK